MNLSLQELAALRVAAKEREDAAVAHRREIDAAIAEAIGQLAEGTKSQDAGDYKVSVTYSLNRKVDNERLQSTWGTLPLAAQNAIKWKSEISITEYRKLGDDDRKAIDAYITSKPAAPAINVEPINKE